MDKKPQGSEEAKEKKEVQTEKKDITIEQKTNTLETKSFQLLQDKLEAEQKDLTLKQSRFLQEYIRTGNATEAAMLTYDCKDRVVARVIGSQNLSKLNVSELMEAMGMTKKSLLQMAMIGMVKPDKAENRLVKVKKTIKKGDKTVEITTSEVRPVLVPDYQTRHRYLETVLKIGKMLGNNTTEDSNKIADNINFIWNSEKKT